DSGAGARKRPPPFFLPLAQVPLGLRPYCTVTATPNPNPELSPQLRSGENGATMRYAAPAGTVTVTDGLIWKSCGISVGNGVKNGFAPDTAMAPGTRFSALPGASTTFDELKTPLIWVLVPSLTSVESAKVPIVVS